MRKLIEQGNIIRNKWTADTEPNLNLYMGSGRCGACFNKYGLMDKVKDKNSIGNTVLMHADHWHRGIWGFDYWLPAAGVFWEAIPSGIPVEYCQELNIFDGILRTKIAWQGLRLEAHVLFHPEKRDLLAVYVRYEAGEESLVPGVAVAPLTDLKVHYSQEIKGSWEPLLLERDRGRWTVRLKAGTADSVLAVGVISEAGGRDFVVSKEGLAVKFKGKKGIHLFLIGCAEVDRTDLLLREMDGISSIDGYLSDAADAWHRRWGKYCISIPDQRYQALWARSQFFLLSSYAPDVRSPGPPCGWSGNAWPFSFPCDLSFTQPALLQTGHLDIIRSWIEYYGKILEDIKAITKEVYKVDGVRWPHILPAGGNTGMLLDGVPNTCHYVNAYAAAPARQAWEACLHMEDAVWIEEIAWPVVRETARFFMSSLSIEKEGKWGMKLTPAMGCDEHGGFNAKNYLCNLYAARYCISTAVKMAERFGITDPDLEKWRKCINTGFAFKRLYNKDLNMYMVFEGPYAKNSIGKQKHPIQLIPLFYLPCEKTDEAEVSAYKLRDSICSGADVPWYYGWTLGAHCVSAVRMNDREGFIKEMENAVVSQCADREWIQVFEGSGRTDRPYYLTSAGLFSQALRDAYEKGFWENTASV